MTKEQHIAAYEKSAWALIEERAGWTGDVRDILADLMVGAYRRGYLDGEHQTLEDFKVIRETKQYAEDCCIRPEDGL